MKILQSSSGKFYFNALLNSYGMLFFSKNKLFAGFILFISLFTPFAGGMALLALLTALVAATAMGLDRLQLESGLLTYSVVLFGLGFATDYEFGGTFLILLMVGSLLTLFLSAALNSILYRLQLPALSLAFIVSSAFLTMAAKNFTGLGLTLRHIYWYNEAYALGGTYLVSVIHWVENLPLPIYVAGYFRSLSAILFQVNVASGILLSLGLLLYSRIAFTLVLIGYVLAVAFYQLMGGFQPGDLSYYNIGTNYMLVAFALGGFYLIPSKTSFAWLLVVIPIASLIVTGTNTLSYHLGIQLYSMPFCLTVLLFLYILQIRTNPGSLTLTKLQYYSPEKNLYLHQTDQSRWRSEIYLNFQLPFHGTWKISQGYDGAITHKGEWSKALDFVIEDADHKTYKEPGTLPDHYYCFNRPILAPADGTIEQTEDHIEDNPIKGNNTLQNWGNTIVIKHADGLYSKLSHLKQHSIQCQKGDYVKKGTLIAYCGNSGRSPEPHLHFQIQSTPHIGSKTIYYPLGYYLVKSNNQLQLKHHSIPREGELVCNPSPNASLQQAFQFQPGQLIRIRSTTSQMEEWEIGTNAYNESFIRCSSDGSTAYFFQNEQVFYFTNFFGNKKGILYHFYQLAYKVVFSIEHELETKDRLSLDTMKLGFLKILQDTLAPFYIFLENSFSSRVENNHGIFTGNPLVLHASIVSKLFHKTLYQWKGKLEIEQGKITRMEVEEKNRITSFILES